MSIERCEKCELTYDTDFRTECFCEPNEFKEGDYFYFKGDVWKVYNKHTETTLNAWCEDDDVSNALTEFNIKDIKFCKTFDTKNCNQI